MINNAGKKLLPITLLFLLLTPLLFNTVNITAQANLIEEEDYFKVFSGNYFNLIIPKTNGPEVYFEIEDFGQIKLKINYISEYDSPSKFLNSLNYLSGKGYELDKINWDIYGISETERTYVNLTRDFLDSNTTLDFSTVISANNQSYGGYNVTALKTAYLQLLTNNWTYSPNVNGLALNIEAEFDSANEYERLGPYTDIENNHFVVKLFSGPYVFEMRFNVIIKLLLQNGEFHSEFTNIYANYNVLTRDDKPADFWISVPYISNIEQILFTFVSTIDIIDTEPTSLNSFLLIALGLSSITIATRIIIVKSRRGNK